jgi:hypothetical protein
METTTTSQSAPIVRPEIGQRVEVTYGADQVIVGVVIDSDADSILLRKETETDNGFELWVPADEAWTLFDVEQADALCVVTVLS